MLRSVLRRLVRLRSAGEARRFAALAAATAPPLEAFAALSADESLVRLATNRAGLSTGAAAERLERHGPNLVGEAIRRPWIVIASRALLNPLVVLLGVLAGSSWVTGDPASAALMAVMLAVGVGLRFVQESHAAAAAATLRSMIRVHATALRDGRPVEVPIEDLVPGDLVRLAAGDMVPADLRLLESKDLFVSQASLTGESFPVEKHAHGGAGVAGGPGSALDIENLCWLGTSVESGTALAVVVATGRHTLLGTVAGSLEEPEPPTAFDVGIARLTWLMVAVVAVMVPVVFLVNGLTKGDWTAALLFALAVAVGFTPEMLPMIVSVCLARGAVGMAKKRVIVKHIDAIQNLGAMDVLCADKTGTLTHDRIILERHCDVSLREDDEVLALAWLNSHFQTGLRNLMDRAILDHEECRARLAEEGWHKVDEIPFDFERRVMSVVVARPGGGCRLVCKGAPEAVLARCTGYELDGVVHPIGGDAPPAADPSALAAEGFRVLAIACRDLPATEAARPFSRDDERDLVLRGYVAFLDPPKESAAGAVAALSAGGVAIKVLTGDNELVSRKVCAAVGIPTADVLLGTDVDRLDDAALAAAAARATLLARLSPTQKRRVVAALRRAGHVVGFIGDGINDAPALRTADVGISVDSAVDIARASADCILLEKDLRVLEAGIRDGRRVFANILKYVRMGASSNFGNILSVVGASAFLPFVPMTPLQLLTNNLLYDCSQVPIPTDDVDPELVARPRPWTMGQIARFVALVGPCSCIFDVLTFAVLVVVFGCGDTAHAAVFRTGWFVESLLTQTLVIHVIRTERIPFLESRASPALGFTTAAVAVVGLWLATGPLRAHFGFEPLPAAFWPVLGVIVAGYGLTTQALKTWLVRRGWID